MNHLPKYHLKVKSLSRVRLFVTPWTVAHQAPPSMGFSRQEYWSGLPFPSPGDLSDPGIEPRSPALQADTWTSEPPGSPKCHLAQFMYYVNWGRGWEKGLVIFLFVLKKNKLEFSGPWCVCVISAAQSCLILCGPMDCSPPGSSVHGISQARIMEWVAISYPRKSSWPRDRTLVPCVSCIGRQILYHWATWESQSMMRPKHMYLKTLHWQLYWVGPKVHYIWKIYGKTQMNFWPTQYYLYD